MAAMTELFNAHEMVLIASLPGNDAALARAAVNGGAHALKVHLNVEHAASGLHFGSFAEEKDNIRAILDIAAEKDVVTGIMPGADTVASYDELCALADMGVRFMDIYEFHLPDAKYLTVPGMEPMIAVGHGFVPDMVAALGQNPLVNMLEASVMHHDSYGDPLTDDDIAMYRGICRDFQGHVTVPTQKKIDPGQLGQLRGAGVRGIMIGAIVTGRDPAGFETVAAQFRNQIDSMQTES